jgi:site-specific DNA recombinase
MTKQAVLYRRVSSTAQAVDGASLAQQEEALVGWAKLNGYEVIGSYADEGVSGASLAKRKGLSDALAKVQKAKATLVVFSLSRLSRSMLDLLNIVDDLKKSGCGLVSLKEAVDTSSACGCLMLSMLGAINAYQRENSNEIITANMASLRKKGKRISRHIPLGWDLAQDGQLVVNEAEQAIRSRILGMVGEGLAMNAIAQTLNAEGVKGKNGGKWYQSTISSIRKHQEALA